MTKFITIPETDRAFLAPLYSKHRHLQVCINAVLQGHCGKARVDDITDASVAELVIGQVQSGTLLTFIGGDSSHDAAKALLASLQNDNCILVDHISWLEMIKTLPDRNVKLFKRYSFSPDTLSHQHLHNIKSQIPEGFTIHRIDPNLASRINSELNTNTITTEFDSPLAFLERGIGYCATYGDKIVCGATSGSMCNGHIEIQVDTLEPYRQKGLASAICATLILHCLDANIVPHWDADNEISVKLAEKLGYVLIDEYDVPYLKE